MHSDWKAARAANTEREASERRKGRQIVADTYSARKVPEFGQYHIGLLGVGSF